ncbi:MAG: peptide transporter permease [Gammaproteobacteria bacterium]|nr:peptide transporter permease [Gammaproteobacteria bacterium]
MLIVLKTCVVILIANLTWKESFLVSYIIRRIFYAIPILIGVNILTFLLFFTVNTPDDMARLQLGNKYVTTEAILHWKQANGYDRPAFYDSEAQGLKKITHTLFFQKTFDLFTFNFGSSQQGRNIGYDVMHRMWPSLALAVPTFMIGLAINISLALLIVFFRRTYLDLWGLGLCMILISISTLFYVIGGQYLFAKVLRLVPISGYEPGLMAIKFLILPVVIGVVSGVGAGVRWYRTIFLEEVEKEYVLSARAQGLSEGVILFKYILKNGMIPVLTSVVVVIPTLFLGSLIMESFFGIPGLGSYTIDAINQQDFEIVRVMVFLGTLFYIVGLILTDISYTLVDPRVRLVRSSP